MKNIVCFTNKPGGEVYEHKISFSRFTFRQCIEVKINLFSKTNHQIFVPTDKDIHTYLCIRANLLVDSFPDVICWNIGLYLFRGKSA